MMDQWLAVCELDDIPIGGGVCALVNEHAIALFRPTESVEVYALGNYDPFGFANVLSRGLIAEVGNEWTVASPMYKHHYNLKTGQCLENPEVSIPTFLVSIKKTQVLIKTIPTNVVGDADNDYQNTINEVGAMAD